MGYIFASGTMFAGLTGESVVSTNCPIVRDQQPIGPAQRFTRRLGAALILVGLLPGAALTTTLDVTIDNLRSDRGELRLCLTADPKNFPGCIDDARAVTRSVPATMHKVHFDDLPYGSYAVAVIHDANGNNKLDTLLGIPREGFGFSRNPIIRFGPPRFSSARFDIGAAPDQQEIKMRYLL